MGLGVFVTAAIHESTIEAQLGLDGVDELALYATGAGIQAEGGPYKRGGLKMSGVVLPEPVATPSSPDEEV
jgi:hypothetical protein